MSTDTGPTWLERRMGGIAFFTLIFSVLALLGLVVAVLNLVIGVSKDISELNNRIVEIDNDVDGEINETVNARVREHMDTVNARVREHMDTVNSRVSDMGDDVKNMDSRIDGAVHLMHAIVGNSMDNHIRNEHKFEEADPSIFGDSDFSPSRLPVRQSPSDRFGVEPLVNFFMVADIAGDNADTHFIDRLKSVVNAEKNETKPDVYGHGVYEYDAYGKSQPGITRLEDVGMLLI